MPGVPRGLDDPDLETGDLQHAAVLHRRDAVGRSREDLPPQRVHPVTVDPGGAGQQLARVDQVGRAGGVDVDARPLLRPPAGGPGVIQMDVSDQDVPDVRRRQAAPIELGGESGQRRSRSRLDQYRSLWPMDQKTGDDMGGTLELQIDGLDAHDRTS